MANPRPNPSYTLRPALPSDIPSITSLLAWYITNTVITLAHTPQAPEQILSAYNTIKSQHLPYIVACNDQDPGEIYGYIYCSGFRAARAGYKHTVEVSLFCHQEHVNKGIGTVLLRKLIEVLREPRRFPEYGCAERAEGSKVRIVIACMSVDETAARGGLALKEWYERFGFEQVGRFHKVGYKFDRWVDTIYLQLELW
ncbi:acetyltransferase [Patellaria atrata CBS 101060]|uniref:Acetyltransferase n=1 Tax=Patellaria atrata CBS 101060 TaxID=1346257 RepID=A0A9P4S777_9PEZI|nr:acetyltransferase [Patellaria atrata CBS 101060]